MTTPPASPAGPIPALDRILHQAASSATALRFYLSALDLKPGPDREALDGALKALEALEEQIRQAAQALGTLKKKAP